MARLIVKSPYIKCGGGKSAGGYLKYIATRERVEIPRGASLVEEGDVLVVSSYPDTLDSRLPEGDPT